jgi:hypothetical protein
MESLLHREELKAFRIISIVKVSKIVHMPSKEKDLGFY